MLKKNLFLFALATLASFFVASQVFSQDFVTKEGHQLRFQIKSEKETIMLGETTYIVFELKNFSQSEFTTSVGGDYRNSLGRPDSYKVTVTTENGELVPQPETNGGFGGLLGGASIPSNGSYIKKLFLPHWATFTKSGIYNINVKRSFSIKNSSEGKTEHFKANASTQIKIIPTNNIKLGDVIDELGSKMLDKDNFKQMGMVDPAREALSLLNFVEDKRAIKYFAEALDIAANSKDELFGVSSFNQIAYTLIKFNNDSAFEALVKAKSSSLDDMRLQIADALKSSKHPKALGELLQMQDDSYWFVRLRVLQAFGDLDTEVGEEIVSKMLKDNKEDIRKYAGEYLIKRKKKIKTQ